MNVFRSCVAAIIFAILSLVLNPAGAEEPKRRQLPGGGRVPGGMQLPGPLDLLSQEAVEKLKLSAEQKEKYDKISTEYYAKQKEAGEKFRASLLKDRSKAPDMQKRRADAEKLRTEYLDKVEALLKAEQKKTLSEVKNQQPSRRPIPGGLVPMRRFP